MLHERDVTRLGTWDTVYSAADAESPLPRYCMPEQAQDPRRVAREVSDELMLDGNSRQNLATFCQTWVEPEIVELMRVAIDKNVVDRDEYPQTAEIESRCVHMLADLWHSPHADTTVGTSTTGSSEAAMLGGMALLWAWREKRRAAGKSIDKPNIITGPVQVCWHKFARYWDVELREIPMEGERLHMTPEEVVKRVDENTIGVVPTLGVTFTGVYEPVAAVCEALDQVQAEHGHDIPVHVDAASGGFLAPFTAPDLLWDFRLPRVRSINASGHKFGLAPLGVGWIVWRDRTDLSEDLVFDVNYLGGNMPSFSLTFSRPGGPVVAQYYTFLRLGREGYGRVHDACHTTAQYLAREITAAGPFDMVFGGDPNEGIPALSWRLNPGEDPGFTLFDLADRLRTRGWLVPAYSMPAHREDLVIQRILVRHGFSRDLATLFIDDFKAAVAHFKDHPVHTPLTEAKAGGFKH